MTGMNLAVSTSAVIPASVAVPLAGAALMAGFSRFLPRLARDLTAAPPTIPAMSPRSGRGLRDGAGARR